uniref:Kringle domain-containing protein n=1 Tax=Branchiostoma floridae TaxID=7739 RepID=C3ZH32_BRAFL|eukprot:XP_002592168.1 hypothetical protein BRAFLDRAFT_88108 [Branchiostoma floridae]
MGLWVRSKTSLGRTQEGRMKLGGGRIPALPIALILLLCVTPWCDGGKRGGHRRQGGLHGRRHGRFGGKCVVANGMTYRGTVSVTKRGRTCQRWDSQTPHQHTKTPAKYPKAGLEQNYCRNPDGDHGGVWCYTTDPGKKWEHCDVPTPGKLFGRRRGGLRFLRNDWVNSPTAYFRPHQALFQFPTDIPSGTTILALGRNCISRLEAQNLESLPDLEVLLIPVNKIAYIESEAFSHVPKLNKMNLAFNQLTDFPWRHMQAQTSLTYLDLAGNSLTSLPSDAFEFLPAMRELRIMDNKLRSMPPGIFDGVPNLKTVYMKGNPWQCDCEFLSAYNTFPPAITLQLSNPSMTCSSPWQHMNQLVSMVAHGEQKC